MPKIWLLTLAFAVQTQAAMVERVFTFNFHETPLTKVVEYYVQRTGQKFVVDSALASNVKITILQSAKVNAKDAFNLLSASLALAGVAISNREGTYVLAKARDVERSFIPVVTELPALHPERLVTWIVTLQHSDPTNMVQQFRTITSRDGEVQPYGNSKLMITDWISNLHRVRDIITQIDKPGESKPVAPVAKDKSSTKDKSTE